MTEERKADGQAARREYMRKWRAEHRESVRAAQQRYWLKKAAEQQTQEQKDPAKPEE